MLNIQNHFILIIFNFSYINLLIGQFKQIHVHILHINNTLNNKSIAYYHLLYNKLFYNQ